MGALLVGVAVALVLVEREVTIGAGVNAQLDGAGGALACVLNLRPKRQNGAGADVERNAVQRRGGVDLLRALQLGASPEVVPDGRGGQIDRAAGCAFSQHWADQQRGAEHELVADVPDLRVLAPIHHQGALHGVVILMHAPGQRVDVGHQPIAQLVIGKQGLFSLREGPGLIVLAVAVGAEDGAEDAVLIPAGQQFLEARVGFVAHIRLPVAADVGGPVGIAGEGKVHAGGHLVRQPPEGAVDIARPHGCAHALLAEEGRAGEQEDALLLRGSAPVILHALRVLQRKDVGVARAVADGELFVLEDGVAHVRPELLGLGAVQPESVPAHVDQRTEQMAPVVVARLGVGGVVNVRALHHHVVRVHVLVVGGFGIEQAPHRKHGVDVFSVQGLQLAGHIGKVLVEDGVAFVLPPEPVLHDGVEREVSGAIARGDAEHLVLRDVAVFGLEEAVGPLRQHGRMAGQVAVAVDDRVHLGAVDEVVVNRVAGQGGELEREREAVVDLGERGGVPHQRVAAAGDQQRNGDIGVVLRQQHGAAAVVEHAALVLAQAVVGLVGVGKEAVGHVVGLLAVDQGRLVGARHGIALAQQRCAVGGIVE